MKAVGRINRNWEPWKPYQNPHFEEGPEFDTEAEADTWLTTKLQEVYPNQWADNSGQYIHAQGHAGDPIVGCVRYIYSEDEQRQMRIKELQEIIADAQKELSELAAH